MPQKQDWGMETSPSHHKQNLEFLNKRTNKNEIFIIDRLQETSILGMANPTLYLFL